MGRLHQIYRQLPDPAKTAVASARGYQLRWRRQWGSAPLIDEALERDRWSTGRWQRYQETRRDQLLDIALRHVPYYRDNRRSIDGDPADLANWPVLSKSRLRDDSSRFVRDDIRFRHVLEPTSGTSGTPLTIVTSPDVQRRWYALFEVRWRRWHGVDRNDRWSNMGGQLVQPVERTEPPFWVWNQGLRQLYCSAYHLQPGHAAAYLDALRRYRVTWLLGYPSATSALARFALKQGLEAPQLSLVLSNAEPLFPEQRRVLSEVFQAPVRDTYGMSEMAGAAGECDHGTMHWWPDAGIWEILDDNDQPVESGREGRLVLTGLLNDVMPLIRYDIGDRAVAPVDGDLPCPCGRALPRSPIISGRNDDLIVTADGREVGRLDPVFKADLPIREAQIIQEEVSRFRILVVPDREWTSAAGDTIAAALIDRVGPVEVDVEMVDSIPRSANGKFRAVISRVQAPNVE